MSEPVETTKRIASAVAGVGAALGVLFSFERDDAGVLQRFLLLRTVPVWDRARGERRRARRRADRSKK